MAKNGNLFIVSAPSGCGKTTIVKKVVKKLPGIFHSISVTTRPPRSGERIRKDYNFVSQQTFRNKAKRGEFLEWTKNFGYYYGTPKKPLYSKLKKGKDIILTIDIKGAAQVKRKMPDSVLIFIAPPSTEELARRLNRRATDRLKDISIRLKVANKEISFSKKYDYKIINDELERAVKKLGSIIVAKRCET